MILTGQAKKDFEKWYLETCHKNIKRDIGKAFHILAFEYKKEVCKQAVIVDWFDSVGIYIQPERFCIGCEFQFWLYIITDKKGCHLNNYLHNKIQNDSRYEATEQAIKHANEIYNERNT